MPNGELYDGAPEEAANHQPPKVSGAFDHLFVIDRKPADQPWRQEVYEQQILPQRAEQLFAPVPEPTADAEDMEVFRGRVAKMLDPSTDFQPPDDGEYATPSPDYPKQTPEDRAAAAKQLFGAMRNDARLAEIIDKYIAALPPGTDLPDRGSFLVDAIHSDHNLRLAVGKHFLSKLEMMVHDDPLVPPDRVVINKEKTPHKKHPIQELQGPDSKMTSREFVAVLCLAKLDGTFSEADAKNDTIEASNVNPLGPGQHRYAADLMLNHYHITEDNEYLVVK